MDKLKLKIHRIIFFGLLCFTFGCMVISYSSFQWLLSDFCCTSGLFMQCLAAPTGCICSGLRENFSWLLASAAFAVMAILFDGFAVGAFIFIDFIRWTRGPKKVRQDLIMRAIIGLTAVAGLFSVISVGVFTSHNNQLVTSLTAFDSFNCGPLLKYGYGYVFAWLAPFFAFAASSFSYYFYRIHTATISIHSVTPSVEPDKSFGMQSVGDAAFNHR